MEEKSEETLKPENKNQSQSLDRPKSFIQRRRKEIFYFSDDSNRGILKRVPVKDGILKITELETVLDKPGTAKTRKEICSGFPFNRPGSSKVNQSNSASKNDNFCKLVYHEQKRSVLKSSEKVDGYLKKSQSLGAHKNEFKDIYEYQDPMTVDNKIQNEICSEVSLHSPGSSKVNLNSSALKNDNVCKPAYHEQKQDIVLNKRGKVDGFMQQSQNLRIYEKDLKAKGKYQDPTEVDNNNQKEICSEVPFNRPRSPKVNQNSSVSKIDNACKPAYYKEKREKIFQSNPKLGGYMRQLQSLTVQKIDLNSKEKYRNAMIDDQQAQEKNMFLKPYKEIERQHQTDGDVGINRDLHGSKSDGISTSRLKNCSSKKKGQIGSNISLYSDSLSEERLSDDLSKMSTDDYQDPLMVDNTTQKRFCSENSINSHGSSKVNQNSSVAENDTACKPVNHKQKKEIILKSNPKVDGCMKQSQYLGAHKKDLNFNEHRDRMIHDDMVEKKNIFLKPCKEIEMQQTKDEDVNICKEFHGSKSDEISTSSLKNCSSKKPEEIRSNNSLYSDSWPEKSLSGDLSKMSVKTIFITEL